MTAQAIEMDLQNLLLAYIEKVGSTSFQDFKKLWIERHFSLIHEGRPSNIERKDYTQLLYNFTLWFLDAESHLAVQASLFEARHAVLYALYLLFETQQSEPKVKIYLPQGALQVLVQTLCEAKARGMYEGAAVMHQLLSKHAFLHGAVPILYPTPGRVEPTVNDTKQSAQLQIAEAYLKQGQSRQLDLKELDKVSREYASARHKVLTECLSSSEHDAQSMPIDIPGLFPSTIADEILEVMTSVSPPSRKKQAAKKSARNLKPAPNLSEILASLPTASLPRPAKRKSRAKKVGTVAASVEQQPETDTALPEAGQTECGSIADRNRNRRKKQKACVTSVSSRTSLLLDEDVSTPQ